MTPEGILKHQNRELGVALKSTKQELASTLERLNVLGKEKSKFQAEASMLGLLLFFH